MKQNYILLSVLLLLSVVNIKSQTFVSTDPQNKNVVLEEYTGITCGFCPEGHKIGDDIKAAHPGRVIAIKIHQGEFAEVIPNFRTEFGNPLAQEFGVSTWPSGTINRHTFGTSVIVNRFNWEKRAEEILAQPSYVNVAAKSTIDWSNRELTVKVEAYYTGNSPVPTNKLNVALLQDSIMSIQSNGILYYPEKMKEGLYTHMGTLRHLLTGQWGDDIHSTSQGSFIEKSYTYIIPEDLNDIPILPDHLRVVVFVSEGRSEILTGAESEISHINNDVPNLRLVKVNDYTNAYTCGDENVPLEIIVKNTSNVTVTSCELGYSIDDGEETVQKIEGRNIAPFTYDTIRDYYVPALVNRQHTFKLATLKANDENINREEITYNRRLNFINAGADLTLKLWTDRDGSETTWSIIQGRHNIVKSGGPYNDADFTLKEIRYDITEKGCYRFEIYDAMYNGLNNGTGRYELWSDDTKVFESEGDFGRKEVVFFSKADDMTPLVVTTESDEIVSGKLNLRDAVWMAGMGRSNYITFAEDVRTIVLSSEITIDKNILIKGNVDENGNPVTTIKVPVTYKEDNGNASEYRLFQVDGNSGVIHVTLSDLNLKGGDVKDNTNARGGVINIQSNRQYITELNLNNIHISEARAGLGGAVAAIENHTVNINIDRCVLCDNTADAGSAVYFDAKGICKIANTLIYHNHTEGVPAGDVSRYGAVSVGTDLMMINSTVVDNTAAGNGAGIYKQNRTGSLQLYNNIIWNNKANGEDNDIYTASTISRMMQYNLIGFCNLGNLPETNYLEIDPVFSDGSYIPAVNSPTINAGNNDYASGFSKDISGKTRVIDGRIDLGAYEYGIPPVSIKKQQENLLNVWTKNGKIYLESGEATVLEVYTLEGKLYTREKIAAGTTMKDLPRGMYILRTPKEAVKVLN